MVRVEGTVEEQLELEKLKTEEGINKDLRNLYKAIERGEYSDTLQGRMLLKLGFEVFVSKLEEYSTTTLYTDKKKERDLLLLITEDMNKVAYVVLTECINSAIRGKTLSSTGIDIVKKLKDIFLVERLQRDNPKLHTYLGGKFRRASKLRKRQLIRKHIEQLYTLGQNEVEDRPIMTRLGTTLINVLELSGANIIEVYKETYERKGKRALRNKIVFTEDANSIITNLDYTDVGNTINKLPMIVPPKDWSNNYNGGFLLGNNFLFTTKSSDVLKHLKRNKYPKLYNIINKLQHTSWRVNTKMLEVLTTVYTDNMIDPKSPSKAPTLYGDLPTRDPYKWEDFIKEDMYSKWHDFNREREDITLRADAEQSKRLELITTLSIAEKMKGYSKLYFPYVFDYRGRVYSDVNFLTPQGQSYTKSLLELGEGRYLNEEGVYWLKIHTANVYGKDKEEYEERIKWFEDNEDTILRVASDPLTNLSDWAWADSPYEYLASCLAWKEHKEGREVHLAIQLDATCSGIQMYSGLLRDPIGAESVNVVGNKRNDIYQIVADKVNTYLEEGKYPYWVEYKDREGVEKSVYTVPIAKSMCVKYEEVEVPDDYILKKGEEWIE